jgi:hypothetical protein
LLVAGGILNQLLGFLGLPLSVWVGGALLALGLNMLVGGDLVVAARDKPFSTRAKVSRAVLEVSSGLSDVQVRSSNSFERLASVRAGSGANPAFEVVDGVARLRIAPRLRWLSGAGTWRAMLATNVLWDVSATSALGHLDFDLSDVRVDRVSVKSDLGSARVTCPRRGRPVLELETSTGDLDVILPPGVGARVRLKLGRLANVDLDGGDFERLDAHTLVTRNVEEADTVAEIALRVWAGEVSVRQL